MSRRFVGALLVTAIGGTLIWAPIGCSSLPGTEGELGALREALNLTQTELTAAQEELTLAQSDLACANITISSLEAELNLYKDTWGTVPDRDLDPKAYYGLDRTLVDNATASNPTWAELLDFLLEDKTDENPYVPGVYECGSFAKDVHNNAESAGIRAGHVRLYFWTTAHSINVFQTTDEGLVFVDCTGKREPEPGRSYDRVVDLKLGDDYAYRFLFPLSSETIVPEKFGPVLDLVIHW